MHFLLLSSDLIYVLYIYYIFMYRYVYNVYKKLN